MVLLPVTLVLPATLTPSGPGLRRISSQIPSSFVIGPVAQFHENSRYYSANPPKPNPEVDNRLPHITIQMPVYKESLKETM